MVSIFDRLIQKLKRRKARYGERGYESQTSDLASEWAYSSHLLQDRDEAIENGYLTIYCKECSKDLRYDCYDYDVPICDSCLEKKE